MILQVLQAWSPEPVANTKTEILPFEFGAVLPGSEDTQQLQHNLSTQKTPAQFKEPLDPNPETTNP